MPLFPELVQSVDAAGNLRDTIDELSCRPGLENELKIVGDITCRGPTSGWITVRYQVDRPLRLIA